MTMLIRYLPPDEDAPRVGVLQDAVITDLNTPTIAAWLTSPAAASTTQTASTQANARTHSIDEVELLPPVDPHTEIWAAGVTYRRSRQARMEESEDRSIYARVYDAQRPELFFKSVGWRAVGHGELVAIRPDSRLNVPEPELALYLTSTGTIAGYTVCNDMSSRDIEGTNPLYLPQAKSYLGACAVGPGIVPAADITDPFNLRIKVTVRRHGDVVWSDAGSTQDLHRSFDDLITHLFTADRFPHGVVLSTGTCLAPPLTFTLIDHDEITVDIAGIGRLTNTVMTGPDAFDQLAEAYAENRHRRTLRAANATIGADGAP